MKFTLIILTLLVFLVGVLYVAHTEKTSSLGNELVAEGFPSLREKAGLEESEFLVLNKGDVSAWSPQPR